MVLRLGERSDEPRLEQRYRGRGGSVRSGDAEAVVPVRQRRSGADVCPLARGYVAILDHGSDQVATVRVRLVMRGSRAAFPASGD
jgi:hypothetical protein